MSAELDQAVSILRAGGLVAFPTETVYGLGCDAANPQAVARLYAAKGRPNFNPLIAHVRGIDDAAAQAILPPMALALAEAFWPGPLTLVTKRRADASVCELACAGLATIAVRAPAHPMAQALLAAFGAPIVAPSANRAGRVSATTAAHVREDFGDAVDLVLEGGPAEHGLESSIVALEEHQALLLRPGAIARDAIEAITGPLLTPAPGAIEAPGMLASHYAPAALLRLNVETPTEGEAYLAFGAPAPAGGLSLSERGDLVEAAANLYAHLRALDGSGVKVIAVAPIPRTGLGEAINDRLARAAAPRG